MQISDNLATVLNSIELAIDELTSYATKTYKDGSVDELQNFCGLAAFLRQQAREAGEDGGHIRLLADKVTTVYGELHLAREMVMAMLVTETGSPVPYDEKVAFVQKRA